MAERPRDTAVARSRATAPSPRRGGRSGLITGMWRGGGSFDFGRLEMARVMCMQVAAELQQQAVAFYDQARKQRALQARRGSSRWMRLLPF